MIKISTALYKTYNVKGDMKTWVLQISKIRRDLKSEKAQLLWLEMALFSKKALRNIEKHS